MAQRTPFVDMSPAQQAGILCNDTRFRQFVGTRTIRSGVTVSPECAAEYLRRTCRINSRRELNTSDGARATFQALRTEFDAWTGKIAAQR